MNCLLCKELFFFLKETNELKGCEDYDFPIK